MLGLNVDVAEKKPEPHLYTVLQVLRATELAMLGEKATLFGTWLFSFAT